jgi:hypothetical protein
MVAAMPAAFDPIAGLVTHIESLSRSARARRAVARWAAVRPELGQWTSPADISAACRAAAGAGQDRLVAGLVAVAAGDELAQLTLMAGLAGRLETVLATWARSAGMSSADREAAATDLVSAAWIAVATLDGRVAAGGAIPERVAWHLIDEAREQVRVPRRRERRAAARTADFDDLERLPAGLECPADDALAGVLVDAVREGRFSAAAVAPVYMTRVAGWPVTEVADRMGCDSAVLRVIRRRVERRLAEAA